MFYSATLLVVFGLINDFVICAEWSYSSPYGPSNWTTIHGNEACGLRAQSPIDIPDATNAQYDERLVPFVVMGFEKNTNVLKLVNNGHTAQLNIIGDLKVSGGGLSGTYNTAQLHFHWGSSSNKGSEHLRNRMAYPLEMHIVNFNSKYNSLVNAAPKPDGLAVLGFWFKVVAEDNKMFARLVNNLTSIQNAGHIEYQDYQEQDTHLEYQLDELNLEIRRLNGSEKNRSPKFMQDLWRGSKGHNPKEVNGRGRQEFLPHLQDIAASMDRKGNCPQLNKQQIKQCIESMQTSGEASLVTHTQDNDLEASGDASLRRTSQLRQKPASGDALLAGSEQEWGRLAGKKTSQLRQKPASGDASLAGSQQSSKDALLDKASSQSQSLSAHQANGDASLVKTSQLRQKPASGDASLAGSQQSSKDALLDKASRDALLAIKTYERGILHQSSSGDASLEKILQSSQNPASRDALLPGQQQSSGDASLDKSIELNMTNTDNSWDNLLMILCSICAKSVNGLVTPTYFLLPM
ncbi:CA [Mytilus coruscus]|uniref:carbonic anhydrase n=1 Tax=Mytilus coruscus TaxID=42192 RepID=A0A6J8B2D9_MYTCO|nr:CA [Mytilus coruscus]